MNCTNKKRSSIMKLNKVLCLFLMLAVVFAFASCDVIENTPIGDLIDKLPIGDSKLTVEFNSNGGSKVDSVAVVEGEPVKAPADPTREGYTFAGWFYNETEWNFENPVIEDMVLVAKWDKLPDPCAHVDKNDDGKCDKCGESFDDGADLPAPTTYHIVYMDGATKLDLTPATYNSESTGLVLPVPAAKTNYEFIGWYSDAALTTRVTAINVNANANIVLYAGYTPVTYRINYVLDGGVNADENVTSYNVETIPASLADASKEGYVFEGWFTDANCTVPFEGITVETIGNVTVYAKWQSLPKEYKIVFVDENNAPIAGLTGSYVASDVDQPITQVYEPDGFVFIGWVNPVTGAPVSVIPANTTGQLILKAKLEIARATYTINYYIDGNLYTTGKYAEGLGLEVLADGNKPGFSFGGWFDNLACEGEAITSIPADATGNINLYGRHTSVTYTVKFFDGETELSFDLTSYKLSGEDIALPAVPEKEGGTIKGWYDAEGNKYTAIVAGTYGDLVLYATYDYNVYYITYHLDGGVQNEDNVESYTHGSIPTLYAPASREGYLFEGWYLDVEYTKVVNDLSEYANQDITLFAKWAPYGEGDNENLTPEVPF